MNIVKIFNIFLLLFIHMFILGTSIMFFPMFGPCIRRIQPTFLAVCAKHYEFRMAQIYLLQLMAESWISEQRRYHGRARSGGRED